MHIGYGSKAKSFRDHGMRRSFNTLPGGSTSFRSARPAPHPKTSNQVFNIFSVLKCRLL